MRALVRAEWPWLLLWSVGGAIVGMISGAWEWSWFLAFAGYALWNLWRGARLCSALNRQAFETLREDSPGLWGELEHALARFVRHVRDRLDDLRERRRLAQSRLQHLPLAVVELDGRFRIRWKNRAAQRLLGLQPQDAGRHIRQFLRMPEFSQWLEKGDFSRPIRFTAPRQRLQVLQVHLIPFESGWLMLAEDVTEAHDLMQMRRDFVANASHELRTPLTVFSGYLETLVELLPDDERVAGMRPALLQMAEQAVRMRRIIDDLLTLAVVERQTTLTREAPVDMAEMFAALREEAELLSAGRHIVTFSCESTPPLCGDPGLLRSVFTNLLSNAVRYTPEGGRIAVRWRRDETGAHFEVEDTGIGIAREHIPRLTERFFRVDTARSRETGGTGLGLAIVKHVLELHGGRLHIDSTPQVGSVFRCDFPLSRLGCHKNVIPPSQTGQIGD